MNRTSPILLLLILWTLLITPVYAAPHLISAQNLGVPAEWAQFNIHINTDRRTYQEGDSLVATVQAERDCYILVYYTNENGYCLIVYPNSYEACNHIRGGESFSIGNNPSVFSLVVDEHKVRDYLQVIATDEPIEVTALAGIRNPEEFVNRLRLILRERVEQRARELKNTRDVALNKKVFAVATTDYLCNNPSYSPPSVPLTQMTASAPVPTSSSGPSPQITIRTVVSPETAKQRIWGPAVPIAGTSEKGSTYELESQAAIVMGTVSYPKGVKNILVNGVKPTIRRLGGAKAIIIEGGEEEPHTTLDFQYQIDDLSSSPRDIVITSEGLDGTTSKKVIQVKTK